MSRGNSFHLRPPLCPLPPHLIPNVMTTIVLSIYFLYFYNHICIHNNIEYEFPHGFVMYPLSYSISHRYTDLCLSLLFCAIDLFVCSCTSTTTFRLLLAFYYILISGNPNPSSLFLFKTVLDTCAFKDFFREKVVSSIDTWPSMGA